MYPDRKEQCGKVNKTKVGDINPRSHFNYQAQRKTTLLKSQNCGGILNYFIVINKLKKELLEIIKLVLGNEFFKK